MVKINNGIETGFKNSGKISRLLPGTVTLLKARPSVGKTTFAFSIIENIGDLHNDAIAYFSLEMSEEQLMYRLLNQKTGLHEKILKENSLSSIENEKVLEARKN